MKPQIIGISGSPIKNSNTDRLVRPFLKVAVWNQSSSNSAGLMSGPVMLVKNASLTISARLRMIFKNLPKK